MGEMVQTFHEMGSGARRKAAGIVRQRQTAKAQDLRGARSLVVRPMLFVLVEAARRNFGSLAAQRAAVERAFKALIGTDSLTVSEEAAVSEELGK